MAHPWVFLLLLILFSGGRFTLPVPITLLAVACG
jgi:hypothetical protein